MSSILGSIVAFISDLSSGQWAAAVGVLVAILVAVFPGTVTSWLGTAWSKIKGLFGQSS